MNKTCALLFSLLLVAAPAMPAETPNTCPCVPIANYWVVTPCETWNCASSALILANGDPYVMSMPTTSSKYKWVVIRRLTGDAPVEGDTTFKAEVFDSMGEATSRYAAMDSTYCALAMSTPDGKALVIALRTPEPRTRIARP
jgi:hypothetical protein